MPICSTSLASALVKLAAISSRPALAETSKESSKPEPATVRVSEPAPSFNDVVAETADSGIHHERVVACAAAQDVVASASVDEVVSGTADDGVAVEAADELRLRQGAVGFVECDDVAVVAAAEHFDEPRVSDGRGVTDWIGTSPLLTRIVPAASRLMVTVLTVASPVVVGASVIMPPPPPVSSVTLTFSKPSTAENVAVTAGKTRRSSSSRPLSPTRRTCRDGR